MDKTPTIGGYIRDAKSDRYGIITQLTDDGGFFARPAELPYTADAAGVVPGAPDGAKVITATHWSPVGNGRWSGIWADAPLNAWTEVYLVHPGAASLGRMGGASTSPAKRAASRANGAKGGRPCTEFREGKVFASEGGYRVCGGVWAGGPIIRQSPWFATRAEADREAAAMLKRRAERDELDRLGGLRPEGL